MPILDTLTLSNTAKQRDNSPEGNARRKLLDALAVQIDAATAQAKGEVFIRRIGRWVDGEEGKERKDVPVRFRPWWFKDDGGSIHLNIRYGNKPLELKAGKSAIAVGSVDNLLPVLEQVKQAIVAGELDKAIAAAAATRQRVLKKPSAAAIKAGKPA